MKKLLLALSIVSMVAISSQQEAFSWSWGCDSCQKAEAPQCGCPIQKESSCDMPKCEQCGREASACTCKDKKLEEFYCKLNLSDCQKQEARKIMDKFDCENEALKNQIKSDKKCLCDAINASCLDKSAVRAAEKQLKTDRKLYKKQFKCLDKEFKGILECSQMGDYRKIKRELRYRTKKGMKNCCKVCGEN